MDQTDRAHDLDPLRRLAEAALGRQETAQRQRADDQAAVDRDQADQAEAADHTQTLAEAQQLAAEVFGAEGAELAQGLTWTASPTWPRRARCCAALTPAARGTPGTPTTHIRGP